MSLVTLILTLFIRAFGGNSSFMLFGCAVQRKRFKKRIVFFVGTLYSSHLFCFIHSYRETMFEKKKKKKYSNLSKAHSHLFVSFRTFERNYTGRYIKSTNCCAIKIKKVLGYLVLLKSAEFRALIISILRPHEVVFAGSYLFPSNEYPAVD